MRSKVPTLTDGTVTLRGHRAGDVQRVWEQCQDPASVRWTTVPSPYSHADAVDFVARQASRWASGAEWGFAVEYAGRFAGSVSLRDEGAARAEIAYGAHPDVRGVHPEGDGRSVMERAVRLLLDWGFDARGLETVVWWANRGNWASRRLAWRLGFSFDGTVRRWLPHGGALVDGWVGTLGRDEPREPRSTWLDVPVVAGDGVVLRPFREDDVVRLVEGSADPDTQYWLAFLPRDPDLSYGGAYLETAREECATASALRWAFSATADGPLLGTVGLFRLRLGRSAEVGFWTHPDARRRRLTTRAAALAVGHAFGALELPRVTAYHTDGNVASQRVLEAVGLRRVGLQRRDAVTGDGEVHDLVGYDLLRDEWRSSGR
ncbi:GNAT family N-acetyltransferase [Nocardioides sp. DS6]|uniref:GNAT family N-acetyltransferase n=1 Tax=Nocardioides eburneus TaxID=3231482 RepID=A0ABV3T3Q0_9ACTN